MWSTRPLVRLLVGVQSTTDWAQTGTQKWGGCQPQVHRLHHHTIHTAHITHHTPSTQHTLYNVHLKLLLAPMEHHTKNIGHYPYNPPQHRSADSTPVPASSYSLTPQQPSDQTRPSPTLPPNDNTYSNELPAPLCPALISTINLSPYLSFGEIKIVLGEEVY